MCLSMSQVVAWKVTWKHNLSAIDGWPITVCCKPHLSCRKTCFFHANRGQQRTKITWYRKTYINTYINTKHVAICCSQIFDAKTHIPSIKYHLGTAAARSRICLETNGAPQRVARSPKWYCGCDAKSSGFLWKTMWKTSNGTMENHKKLIGWNGFHWMIWVVFHGSSTNETMELDGIGTKVSCQKWSLSIREKQHYCAFRKTRKPLWHTISDHRLLDVVGCCWIKGEPSTIIVSLMNQPVGKGQSTNQCSIPSILFWITSPLPCGFAQGLSDEFSYLLASGLASGTDPGWCLKPEI